MDKNKTHGFVFYAVLLAVGLAFIVAGFLLFVSLADTDGAPDTFANIVCTLCGAVFLYLSMVCTRRSSHLFVGLFLTSSGAFSLLVAHRLVPYSMHEWWPMLVIFSGISFFVSGVFRRKATVDGLGKPSRLSLAIVFPTVTLIVLGALFMLFSFHIAPISFRSAVSIFGPFCLIAMGVFIVSFFLLQRKYNALCIREDEDDNADLSNVSAGDN